VVGGIGGIVSGDYPRAGTILTVIGLLGALWVHFDSESKSRDTEDLLEAQAMLFAEIGIGSVYTRAGKLALHKDESIEKAIARFEQALKINPMDVEALASLGSLLAKNLAFAKWLGKDVGIKFQESIVTAKAFAQNGMRIAPEEHIFHDLLGVIFDLEGLHEQARQEFQTSGKLRKDPYWRLLLANSWEMSGNHGEGLAEIERAIAEGADHWVLDFYHGRSLTNVGDYDKAIPFLNKVLKDGSVAEFVGDFRDVFGFRGASS